MDIFSAKRTFRFALIHRHRAGVAPLRWTVSPMAGALTLHRQETT